MTAAMLVAAVALVSVGRFIGPDEPTLPKVRQVRLYFPTDLGAPTIAPPRVHAKLFPGPLP